jgi:hypothetical protein
VALTTDLDNLFRRHQGTIPVAFLRALSSRESGFQSRLAMPGGPGAARGLLQIVGCVRVDYNRAHQTHYTADDLFDPDVNVQIAVWVLEQIVNTYANHPSLSLHVDWTNPEFVKLVVAGWNSGFSQRFGVGLVAGYLEKHGVPVTLANVFRYASTAGASVQLQRSAKLSWQLATVALYFDELALERTAHAVAI